MASIIEQIQRDALDRSVPVSDLLRRVKLAAVKLGLGVVEDWVEQELSGYKSSNIPEYRILHGRPLFQRPLMGAGWELIAGDVGAISERHIGQSIASLEELAKAPDDAAITFSFSDALVKKLNETNGTVGWNAVLQIDRSAIVSILDQVRNQVLDWALKLERAGITGTEFNFNAFEKERAADMTTTINIGTIGSFAGNLGAGNISGDIIAKDIDTKVVRNLNDQLKAHLAELIAAGADGNTLKSRIELIETELRKEGPSSSILRGLLVDVRNSITGAAGNLMATGATALINQILGTGVPAP